ncbi:ubiquinone biosynthesis accessory factor UbiK [Algicola sagamiensis]|uniref:ubiquinone biosynthesis accessory factor UbiK n=1 Tax=Algicola sagamiensis TaxID=163869 RepID=UPI0003744360|nr:accessory factor UbiK family protein [Algicola sagamiensis]
MLNPKKLEEIAKQVSDSLPSGLKQAANDVETKTKQVLQQKLAQLDFVSREEFDIQLKVLQRTREHLHALEQKVEALEQQLLDKKEKSDDQDE